MTTAATGSLALEVVEPHLRGRFGMPYLYEAECESTQLVLAGSGLPEGAVAVADHQTGGRGRLGRRWEETPGTGVLVSILLHPPSDRRLPELSLVAALATAEAVEGATGLTAQVKWPNDVMLNRRKVAGIISELADGVVVVGIGINANQTREQLPADAATPPASLRTATGSEHDPLPIGEWKVKGVQYNPVFNYNPDLFWDADPSHAKAKLAAGPNNPVGVVWIDLSKEHYGIHGTPEPAAVGKTASHGCVRMTNWDALTLARLVRPGTRVIFRE